MIAEIIATLLTALGVATGNINSNVYKGGNAFNNELKQSQEKTPIKRENEVINDTYEISNSEVIGQYTAAYGDYAAGIQYTKKYLSDGGNEYSPTYLLPNMLIYNSIYEFQRPINNDWAATIILIMKITNLYTGNNTFTMNAMLFRDISNNNITKKDSYISHDDSLMQAIDLTMNEGTINTWNNIWNNAEKELLNEESVDTSQMGLNPTIENETPTITLMQGESVYIILSALNYVQYINNWPGGWRFMGLEINTTYIAPRYNYEIVDIPNLLYTVLTMPFSFISTAFNLTIFPNTPYAINFSNLFMVFLSIFVLMWLIRKVFK